MHPSVLFEFCVSSLQDAKELKFSVFFFPSNHEDCIKEVESKPSCSRKAKILSW